MNTLELVCRHTKVGDFTLRSGKTSDLYVDVKSMLLDSQSRGMFGALRNEVSKIYAAQLELGMGAIQVLGRGYGGAILVAGLVAKAQFNGIVIRQGHKDHGLKDSSMGKPAGRSADKVVIVEDVITTGGSTKMAIRAAEAMDLQVLGVVAVVDRTATGGDLEKEVFSQHDVRFLVDEVDIRKAMRRN